MRLLSGSLGLFLAASPSLHGLVVVAQNCPFLGPAYPPATDITAPAFVSTGKTFESALASALAEGKMAGNDTFWAFQVYTLGSKKPIYEAYHSATVQKDTNATNPAKIVGPDTVFRVYSISKLITVYAILAKVGDKYWDEPVAKYIPELSRLRPGNPVREVRWDEVTIGSLASLMSGVGRDYALNDQSAGGQPRRPGFREIEDSDVVRCGSEGLRPCNREESLRSLLKVWPFSRSFNTPNYSNMAFQLLGYAIENITGTPFPTIVQQQLFDPLHLRHSFVAYPANITDYAPAGGWATVFDDIAPMGGYYQSANDLSALGASILNSTLLPPATTRKWMKPLTHTSSLFASIGRPWEIIRRRVPVSSTTKTTRVVDVYTKQGGGSTYTSLIALSRDHDLGISILTAGPRSNVAFQVIKRLALEMWIPAAEQAARDAAGARFGGSYSLPSSGRSNSSYLEMGLHPDEPGLFVSKMVSNGTDMLDLARTFVGGNGKGGFGMWLYPMDLVGREDEDSETEEGGDDEVGNESESESGVGIEINGKGKGQEMAFRGAFGEIGVPADAECATWAEVDRLRYGRNPGDLAVFEVDGVGRTTGVLMPMLSGEVFGREVGGD